MSLFYWIRLSCFFFCCFKCFRSLLNYLASSSVCLVCPPSVTYPCIYDNNFSNFSLFAFSFWNSVSFCYRTFCIWALSFVPIFRRIWEDPPLNFIVCFFSYEGFMLLIIPTSPPWFFSISFNILISSANYLSNASFGSSLIFGLFFIYLALLAYLSVPRVSS